MSRLVSVLSLGVTVTCVVACNSSTQNVTSPSVSKCAIRVTATPTSFSASGGTGTLNISTSRECQWAATATSSWIQLSDSATGQGDASTSFTVRSNSDLTVRHGAITVGDQRVALTQEAAQCVFTVSPDRDSVGA